MKTVQNYTTRSALLMFAIFTLFFQGEASAQGVWLTDSSTGFISRYGHTSSVVDGKIYIIGGDLCSFDSLQVFDPAAHVWSTPKVFGHFTPCEYSSSCVANNKIYVIGGNAIHFAPFGQALMDTVFEFDPSTNTWSIPVTSGTFAPREKLSVNAVNGKIYSLGGWDSSGSHFYPLEVFDPSSSTWSTPVASGSLMARDFFTTSVVNDKIYVIGGGGPCQVFDPSTNTWSTFTSVGFTPRNGLTSSVVDGKIYAIGGSLTFDVAVDIVEVFDPVTNTWSTPVTTGTFNKRVWLSSSVVNGRIYVIGGYHQHGELSYNEVLTPGVMGVSSSDQTSPPAIIESYPDPISSTSTISFTLAAPGAVSLTLTDPLGRVVSRPLVGEMQEAGKHDIPLDLSQQPAGVFYLRITLGTGEVRTIKLVKE